VLVLVVLLVVLVLVLVVLVLVLVLVLVSMPLALYASTYTPVCAPGRLISSGSPSTSPIASVVFNCGGTRCTPGPNLSLGEQR
jgi:hypothetical protein